MGLRTIYLNRILKFPFMADVDVVVGVSGGVG